MEKNPSLKFLMKLKNMKNNEDILVHNFDKLRHQLWDNIKMIKGNINMKVDLLFIILI